MQGARGQYRWWIAATALLALRAAVAAAAAPGSPSDRPHAARSTPGPTALSYTVKPGDNLIRICSELRDRTGHFALDGMMADVRRANDLETNRLWPGQVLLIPAADQKVGAVVARTVAEGAEVRGIYLSGPACGAGSVLRRVDRFIAAGGNTVVFDAKDIDGAVSFPSAEPLAGWGPGRPGPVIPSLEPLLFQFHRRGLHVVARLAVFLDGDLGRRRPDLALQDSVGGAWAERGCVWLDPARAEVRRYHLALAAELARSGVDEIQLDYVRYPTNGWRGDGKGDAGPIAARRREAITSFVTEVREALRPTGVLLSVDVFGIMGWEQTAELALAGQDIPALAGLVDAVCPMIYPSHFAPGFAGFRQPAEAPAELVAEAVRRFRGLAGRTVGVRPWLQAFPWRVRDFGGDYVAAQVTAARESGAAGWCLWNSACQYEAVLSVLPSLCGPRTADVSVLTVAGDRPTLR